MQAPNAPHGAFYSGFSKAHEANRIHGRGFSLAFLSANLL